MACAAEEPDESGGNTTGASTFSSTSSSSGGDDQDVPQTDEGDGDSATSQGEPSTDSTGDPGPTTSADESGTSTDTGVSMDTTTGAAGTVSGAATRSVMPAPGGDAIGPLYVALADACSFTPAIVAATSLPADLSDPDAAQPFALESVPDGDWFLIAFLDDDGDATPAMPGPGSGDFVVSDGLGGIGCVAVTVAGDHVDGVNTELNFVLP